MEGGPLTPLRGGYPERPCDPDRPCEAAGGIDLTVTNDPDDPDDLDVLYKKKL